MKFRLSAPLDWLPAELPRAGRQAIHLPVIGLWNPVANERLNPAQRFLTGLKPDFAFNNLNIQPAACMCIEYFSDKCGQYETPSLSDTHALSFHKRTNMDQSLISLL